MSEIKTNKISSLTSSNSDITLDPDGTGDVVVASGHKLGIGTTAPALPLEVNGSTNVAVFRSDASNSIIQLANSTGTGGDNGTLVGSVGDDLYFRAGDAERVRIDSSGNVGIGTNSPGYPMELASSSGAGTQFGITYVPNSVTLLLRAGGADANIGTVGSHPLLLKTSNTERVRITNGGINSQTIYNNPTVSGANLFISGGYNFQRSTSSSRYKTEITDATHGLDEVMNLRPVTYKGINDGDRVFGGLIAEEVHDAGLTEFVDYSEDEDGNERPEGLHYGHMAALAFKAIQELKTELDAEKAKVADLEARVTALENA